MGRCRREVRRDASPEWNYCSGCSRAGARNSYRRAGISPAPRAPCSRSGSVACWALDPAASESGSVQEHSREETVTEKSAEGQPEMVIDEAPEWLSIPPLNRLTSPFKRERDGEAARDVGVFLDGDEEFGLSSSASWPEVREPVPVYVMLPLDCVSVEGKLQHVKALDVSLKTLKQIGVEGVMIDVWWGIVERDGPKIYDWSAYKQLLGLVKSANLKLQAVMSFHACGANVGDVYEVKLPQWVLDAQKEDPDLFFTDQYGYRNPECISLWADHAMTLQNRTPLQCYHDFMASFKREFADDLSTTLTEVSVGCGPCGELRYPAYPENKHSPNSSQWRFPGIGEFQCYDQRALGALARAGSEAGHIEWGGSGPHDAGGYNNLPQETGFFRANNGSWDSPYGQFFLEWYSGELVKHGELMLRCARSVFDGTGVHLAIKCAGVHWWYNSRSHAAELTAGYFNTRSGDRVPERDGYEPIVRICSRHGARLNFTCVEMRDIEHPWFSRCGPEGLLRQVRAAAARYGVKVAGENALCRFDADAYEKIITNCRGEGDDPELWRTGQLLPPMASFTFLRLSKELFEDHNFKSFVGFVQRMIDETGPDAPPASGANKDEDREDVSPVGTGSGQEAEATSIASPAGIFSEMLPGDAEWSAANL